MFSRDVGNPHRKGIGTIDENKLLELFEQDDDTFRSQDIRHIIMTLAKDKTDK